MEMSQIHFCHIVEGFLQRIRLIGTQEEQRNEKKRKKLTFFRWLDPILRVYSFMLV